MKGQATRTGRMYLQYIYLIKGLYLQFTKYSYHLIIKQQQQKPTLSKWVNDLKRCFSKKDVRMYNKYEKLLTIISHQKHAN